jgi:hypothetical protein
MILRHATFERSAVPVEVRAGRRLEPDPAARGGPPGSLAAAPGRGSASDLTR